MVGIILKYISKELGVKGWNGQNWFVTASNVNSVNMIMYQMNNHTLFKQDHQITF